MAVAGELPANLDRSHELFYVQLVFLLVAGISVLIRIYVKTFLVRHNALDDYLIYAAFAGYVAYATIAMDGAINGATGKHYALRYTMDQAARSLRGWYLCMVLYAPITLTIRASVCVLLLRLATSRAHRWIIWANLAVIAAISAAFFFILAFQCSPPSHFWTQVYGTDGHCYSKLIVTYATTVHSCVSCLSDWCLGLLPVALLWNVKINRRTKATIAVLLSLGMIDVAIWSVMEPALGITAACVATFRPLFKNWGFGWSSYGNNNNYNHRRKSGYPSASGGRLQLPSSNPSRRDPYGRHESLVLSRRSTAAAAAEATAGGRDGDGDVGRLESQRELTISKTVRIEVETVPRISYDDDDASDVKRTFYRRSSDGEDGVSMGRVSLQGSPRRDGWGVSVPESAYTATASRSRP
ncbi:uncharacterized protein VDAG_06996 [Verticillium dahliae VdLs.17]|uniref:Rhodopsin domain-containing protein n=1 Tax=Verticillium dahliae (strain VdLs.17 / ATCC MYA-4575 / FGSC 10137) TaxID=498257 RepID=G2XA93_VERDV|nr:uncharacterized protein VDAG_06996 [Verticillium dahliae VdLs.17]EGY15832.1 hypothetical protein VDAG_06996 [Verticillium dahliae VdLs.17]